MNGLSVNRLVSAVRAVGICACAPFLIAFTSRSQTLRFDHLSTEHGLSQDIVTAIIQDSRGFLWFGTEDGLNANSRERSLAKRSRHW